jgi:cytosine deaminase
MDLVLKNARLDNRELCDIGIANGRIAAIRPRLEAESEAIDLQGRLVSGGFIETHLHLDKSCIIDRCTSERGDLAEAIGEAAKAKAGFTAEDVHARASLTLIWRSTPESGCAAWRVYCR